MTSDRLGEASAGVWARVEQARAVQRARFAGVTGTRGACLGMNADMGPTEVREYCKLDDAGKALTRAVMQQLQIDHLTRAFSVCVSTCASHRRDCSQ